MKYRSIFAFIRKYYPWIVVSILFVFIFRKVFFQGLYPYPGDLLVSFFFPYSSGGWEGYNSWITHKEFVSADVVRQLYPWRELAIDLLKSGTLPLWNPYAFSGTPLAANVQSAAFYPVNVLFFLLPFFPAWNIYILLQPILACLGMYVFIRSLKLSSLSAIFSGLAFAFLGYFGIWFELGVVGHTALWLPYALWGMTEYKRTRTFFYLIFVIVSLCCALLAGHAQTAAYVFILSSGYFFFLFGFRTIRAFLLFGSIVLSAVSLAALQLLPSFELLMHSARNVASSSVIFRDNLLPLNHLVTLFAPDFFGNQTTNNYWGENYGEFMAYIGVVALTLSVIGAVNFFCDRVVRFFLAAGIISLLFAIPGPFSESLLMFNVPILSSGIPARALFLVSFCFVALTGYGVEALLQKKKSVLFPLLFLGGVYGVLWGMVIILPMLQPDPTLHAHFATSLRNMILPTGLFIATGVVIGTIRFFPRFFVFGICILLIFAAFEYQYFLYKFSPFAPAAYLYPEHPITDALKETVGFSRIYGYSTARPETNLPTAWRVQSPEGYDPLYLRHYGELMYAGKIQKYTTDIPRSDAVFPDSLPTTDPYAKQVLLNLMDVRFIADKNDQARPTPDTSMYPEDRFKRIWHDQKWNIYENLQVLPRAAVFYSWEIARPGEETIRRLFNPVFSYTDTLLLPTSPGIRMEKNSKPTAARITAYTPNRIVVTAEAEQPGILFLSDVYYPGWKASVDGKETEILRTDHSFRGVVIPEGSHTVVFRYQPMSFFVGASISGIALIVLMSVCAVQLKVTHPFFRKKIQKKKA